MIGTIREVEFIGLVGSGAEERGPPPDPVDLVSPTGAPLLSADGSQLQFQPPR